MIPIWGFVAVTIPLVVTPGASTAVVLRNSISGGTRAGIVTAIGLNTGTMCYGLLTAFGFAAALHRWPSVWIVLRVSGVLYLTWLGVVSLVRAAAPPPAVPSRGDPPPARDARRQIYEGFVTNALNPALATFYFVLLPQFIPRGAPVARSALLLTAIHIALAGSWHLTWAVAGGTLARVLSTGRPRQVLGVITGVALLCLAASMALG